MPRQPTEGEVLAEQLAAHRRYGYEAGEATILQELAARGLDEEGHPLETRKAAAAQRREAAPAKPEGRTAPTPATTSAPAPPAKAAPPPAAPKPAAQSAPPSGKVPRGGRSGNR